MTSPIRICRRATLLGECVRAAGHEGPCVPERLRPFEGSLWPSGPNQCQCGVWTQGEGPCYACQPLREDYR